MIRASRVGAALLCSACLFAACGTSSPPSTTTTSTTTSTTTTTAVAVARDLVVTPAVRAGLITADAAYHSLPVSDYTGLDPGMTYYAFDPADDTYYAAAGLIASPNSQRAQIGDQDDGGYNLFTRSSPATTWTVYNDGLGAAQDSTCPISIPASVLAAWNWKPKSCFPPLSP
ncbi:MAG: hypothetical protein WA786_03060 [Acidimicrobiales bacterium]